MIALLALLLCLAPLPGDLDVPDDLDGRVLLAWESEPAAPLVGEPFELRLRFSIEADFLEQQVVPLFRRELDLDVQLESPWATVTSGLVVLDEPRSAPLPSVSPGDPLPVAETGGGRPTFALDGEVVTGERLPDRLIDGRRFVVVQRRRRLAAEYPGTLSFPAPVLRLAYATEFEDLFVDGRVPVDRREAAVEGAPLDVVVGALPETGRPLGFGGAVGDFTVSARTDHARLEAGGLLTLTLTVRGRGADGLFTPPDLADLDGFHLIDIDERRTPSSRDIRYQLSPTSSAVEFVPKIMFSAYRPGRGGGAAGYVTLIAPALPLIVTGSSVAEPWSPAPPPVLEVPPPAFPVERGEDGGLRISLLGLVLMAVVALIVIVYVVGGR